MPYDRLALEIDTIYRYTNGYVRLCERRQNTHRPNSGEITYFTDVKTSRTLRGQGQGLTFLVRRLKGDKWPKCGDDAR